MNGFSGWKALGFETYEDYLLHWMWAEKREMMLMKYPVCYDCNEKATEVHHLSYAHVGNEGEKDLMTLCRECHKKREDEKKSKHNS